MKVYAPGKLILSGEHAVVYGNPALAMAVNRYVTATVTQEGRAQILFDLADIAHRSRLNLTSLRHLKDRIKRKYHRFIRGEYSIRDVLQKPFELAQFALGVLAEARNVSLPHGVKIHVTSDIPMGCGMGSSAATILSVMQAVSSYLHVPLSKEALYQLALETENMQHGRSSGLDLRVALQGGCLYVEGSNWEPRSIPSFPLYLINTGTPATTTGQCVEKVAPHFKQTQMNADFAAVTRAMDDALQQQSIVELHKAVRENHKLLNHIGVVPNKVAEFISKAEQSGASAKICGAGAVGGDHAGVVIAMTNHQEALARLCDQYGYTISAIAGDVSGVHAG